MCSGRTLEPAQDWEAPCCWWRCCSQADGSRSFCAPLPLGRAQARERGTVSPLVCFGADAGRGKSALERGQVDAQTPGPAAASGVVGGGEEGGGLPVGRREDGLPSRTEREEAGFSSRTSGRPCSRSCERRTRRSSRSASAWQTATPSVCCRSWSKSVQDGLPRQATKRGGNRSGGVGRRTRCGGWGVLGC